MPNLCIIPARGGSKRIPRKNIKNFLGKPIIAYSIEAALESGLFDEVMVSTDDLEIVAIAKKYGAVVPFMRSPKNSDDYATTYDVIEEVINGYQNLGKVFENTCCLYPTAPFITASKLKSASELLKEQDIEAVFSVVKYSYPIQRSLIVNQQGAIEMSWPENKTKRSQDLNDHYHDAGQFYFYETNGYLQKKGVFNMLSKPIVFSELEVQDIDNEVDWKLAELKYKLLNGE
ncbi:MAG: pseudaminic acid cytidylyltransferase [Flavobacteriales bacterium]|jgi:N-acylneuraminate cytidylyltransferase|nr:pseudaminic acid cytidylyltransferase [Flavobacteriales bacterium]